ncbi:MAG: stage II sporulation protein M [Planctomycetota bacterium]|nr:stage II sporulation protein M [Planctomycetota bacterium]
MLDPNRFVKERQEDWQALENELDRLSTGSFQSYDAEQAKRLGTLYRRASADLIRARSESANEPMTDYLNGLVGRSYGLIYRGKQARWTAFLEFIAFTFPHRVRLYKKSVLAAAMIFFVGAIFGIFAEYFDSSAKFYLLPDDYAQVEERIEEYKSKAQAGGIVSGGQSAVDSATIMTNNIKVSFLAFALGATLGIGTVIVIFYNGVMLGVLAAVFLRHGLSLYFWAYILPHGILELTCIFVAGAAGFLLARAIVAPGMYGRREALKRYGQEAVILVSGCGFLLIFAGLIEGFITPQGFIPHGLKLLFAFATFLGLAAYFVLNESILRALGFSIPPQQSAL